MATSNKINPEKIKVDVDNLEDIGRLQIRLLKLLHLDLSPLHPRDDQVDLSELDELDQQEE